MTRTNLDFRTRRQIRKEQKETMKEIDDLLKAQAKQIKRDMALVRFWGKVVKRLEAQL